MSFTYYEVVTWDRTHDYKKATQQAHVPLHAARRIAARAVTEGGSARLIDERTGEWTDYTQAGTKRYKPNPTRSKSRSAFEHADRVYRSVKSGRVSRHDATGHLGASRGSLGHHVARSIHHPEVHGRSGRSVSLARELASTDVAARRNPRQRNPSGGHAFNLARLGAWIEAIGFKQSTGQDWTVDSREAARIAEEIRAKGVPQSAIDAEYDAAMARGRARAQRATANKRNPSPAEHAARAKLNGKDLGTIVAITERALSDRSDRAALLDYYGTIRSVMARLRSDAADGGLRYEEVPNWSRGVAVLRALRDKLSAPRENPGGRLAKRNPVVKSSLQWADSAIRWTRTGSGRSVSYDGNTNTGDSYVIMPATTKARVWDVVVYYRTAWAPKRESVCRNISGLADAKKIAAGHYRGLLKARGT